MHRLIGGFPPAPTPADRMIAATALLTRMGEVDEAAHRLLDARQRAFQTKRAFAEAERQFELAEAEIVLDGLSGSNERERKADLTTALPKHPAYAEWLRCQEDAVQAQHDAEAAQTRFDTAKALLRAATAAVGASGGS